MALLVVVFALLAEAEQAAASVTIGSEQIVLSSEGAGAIVTRSPFRVVFTGAGGGAVLSEAENVSESTLPLERSAIQPANAPTGPSSYSPLSFLSAPTSPKRIPRFATTGPRRGSTPATCRRRRKREPNTPPAPSSPPPRSAKASR